MLKDQTMVSGQGRGRAGSSYYTHYNHTSDLKNVIEKLDLRENSTTTISLDAVAMYPSIIFAMVEWAINFMIFLVLTQQKVCDLFTKLIYNLYGTSHSLFQSFMSRFSNG